MKTLYESLLNNANGSIEKENIEEFLKTSFNKYSSKYTNRKYNIGKDSKGWYVDIILDNILSIVFLKDQDLVDLTPDINTYNLSLKQKFRDWKTKQVVPFRIRNFIGSIYINQCNNFRSMKGIDKIIGNMYFIDMKEGTTIDMNDIEITEEIFIMSCSDIRLKGKCKCSVVKWRPNDINTEKRPKIDFKTNLQLSTVDQDVQDTH